MQANREKRIIRAMTSKSRKTVLSISSQVVRGHVGNSAAVFALQMQGFDVLALPTVILSNHPGHGKTSGERLAPACMTDMLATLDGHGWLGEVDAVISGYIPDPEQVETVARTVESLKARRTDIVYCCDPVMGDHGKGLYVAPDAAAAIRDRLVALADIVTPNHFELCYLAGEQSRIAGLDEVTAMAQGLAAGHVLVTSAEETAAGDIHNLLVTPHAVFTAKARRLDKVPNGTGDLISALMLACRLEDIPDDVAIETCTGTVAAVIDRSLEAGAAELELIACRTRLPVRTP